MTVSGDIPAVISTPRQPLGLSADRMSHTHRRRACRRLLAGVASLVLAGCVTPASAPRTLSADAAGQVREHNSVCAHETVGAQPAARTVLGAERLQVVVWNMHKGGDAQWDADFTRVSASADLLLLQEARLTPALRSRLDTRDYFWTLNAPLRYRGQDTGVLTAANSRSESWCSLQASEPWLRVPKAALVTRHALAGGGTLLVANLHAINFAIGTSDFRAQLAALGERLAAHDGPMILAGDFNTWSRERQAVVTNLTRALDLAPVTFAADRRSRFFGEPVDHVYYRGLVAEPAEVLTVTASDHHALRVVFRRPAALRVASAR